MKGQTGSSMVTRESYARQKRRRRARKREEARWAALSGPVVSYVDESVRRPDQDPSVPPAT